MRLFRSRSRATPTSKDVELAKAWHAQTEQLANASEEARQAALPSRMEAASRIVPKEEARAARRMTDDEADAVIAEEIRVMKSRDPQEWRTFVASFPAAERGELEEIARRHGV